MTGGWLRAVAAVLVLAVLGSSQLAAVMPTQIDGLQRSADATRALYADDRELPPDEALPKRLGVQLSADHRTGPHDRERQAFGPDDATLPTAPAERHPPRALSAASEAPAGALRPCRLRHCGNRDPPLTA